VNHRTRGIVSLFTALVALLVLSLQPARAATWNYTQIDNSADVGKSLSMGVDPDGKLYIGYLDDNSPDFLKYATNAGGTWAIESLANILPYALNTSTATVFTPGGPRIMAYTYNSTYGKYMYRAARKVTGDGWQVQDIAGGISPLDGSIQPAMSTINSAAQTGSTQYMGFTYITYNDGTKLWYANERDMAWYNISNAGTGAGQGGIQSDLAIDSNGNVHVLYVDALNNLYYAKNPTAPGAATNIYDNRYPVSTPSIAIDSNNVIHLVFAVRTNKHDTSKVYYMKSSNGGTTWSTPVGIGQAGKAGGYTTLKIDSANNLHAAWNRSDTGSLHYNMMSASGTWAYSTIYGEDITYTGAPSSYGQYAAMAIDQYNNVHIAYYDVTNSALAVVTKPNPAIDASPSPLLFGYVPQYSTSEPQTLTIANKGNTNLTISSIGSPTSADFEVVSNGCTPLPITLAAGASCTVSYQFDPDLPGDQTATVAIGSNDPNSGTKTVTLKGTATYTANHTIMAGTMGPGGTISPAGMVSVPHGVNQTFTITPDPGYLAVMVAVDPTGMTQEEMMAASKGALSSYTFNQVTTDHGIYVMFMPYVAVTTWSTTEVDNALYTGRNCSLTVDPDNKLHIGYLESSASTFTSPYLKYATNAGGTWSRTSLKDILPNAMNASTATVFTPAGPRVLAYSYDSATLAYKYQAARKLVGENSWQLQDVGGGISPLDGSLQPAMTTVSGATQTGALQHTGFTFITFNNGNYLQYANERDMAWYKITDAGTAAGNGGIQSDLTIDSAGNIHAVYADALNNLMYAMNPKNPGEAATIMNTAGVISNPNIAITADNMLHVVYLDTTGAAGATGVMYIKKPSGGAWTSPILVGPAGTYGGYAGIKADNTGGIHISYYYANTTTTGLLMYQHFLPNGARGSQEIIRDADNSANYGQYAVMAIDNNNIVNIAYYDATRSSLKVVRQQTFGINAAPSPLYFGNIAPGATATATVAVTNRGTSGSLKIMGPPTFSGANASEFSVDSSSCSDGLLIAPGAAGCEVTVRFTPDSTEGAKTANLIIGSNDLLIPYESVPLSGTSYASNPTYTINAGVMGVGGRISPAGPVSVIGSANQTFTITPDPGYVVGMVMVDPVFADPMQPTMQEMAAASRGALLSYTFNQVTANHGIYVMFMQAIPVTGWAITEVDDTATETGKYCSITNDLNGRIYVGYLDTTNLTAPILKYATNKTEDGLWDIESVSTIPNVTAAGTATVFSEGIGPRIMAYAYDGTTRKYAAARKWTETDSHWQLQYIAGDTWPIGTGFGLDGTPQLPIINTTDDTFTGAVQSDGYTFITFTDGNNLWYANEKDFYYLKLDAANAVAGAGKQSDLVLDSDKNIHLVYYTPGADSTGQLRYGYGQGGYLDPVNNPPVYTEDVLIAGITSDPSITIDGNDTLHVSYIQSGRVKYLTKPQGGSWSSPLDIGPCGVNGAYTSIKANGLNIVHLTYYAYNSTNSSGKLMYVTRSAEGQWSAPQAVPDTSANVGQYAALTVDDHHNVNIAYYDVSRRSLKVGSRQIPVITAPTAVNFGTVSPMATASQTITVANAGQADLRVGTATLSGTNADKFWIDSNSCDGAILTAGGSGCSIVVKFAANSSATYTATLHVTSDDRYTPDHQAALTAVVSEGTKYTVTTSVNAAAGTHGSITPGGSFQIPAGGSQRFVFSMDPGFYLKEVKVDGVINTAAVVDGYYDVVEIAADHTLEATFESYVKVGQTFIGSIQAAAYEAANFEQPIKARSHTFAELLVLDLPTNILLEGGYEDTYTTQIGHTVIKGTIEISDGGIEVEQLGVQ
jgi:hypothetical protein